MSRSHGIGPRPGAVAAGAIIGAALVLFLAQASPKLNALASRAAGDAAPAPAAPLSEAPGTGPRATSSAEAVLAREGASLHELVLTTGADGLLPAWEPLSALLGPIAPEELADPAPSVPARLEAMPFRTQRDGSQWAGSNCGPAALAMVLAAYGIGRDNDELRYLSHTYQGTWGRRTGTALEHLARVAEDFGVRTSGLYTGEAFRRWTVADVRAEVGEGHPVIALVKYRLLPGREYSNVRFDHYVVLWALTPDGFVYNDPIYPGEDEGFARVMTNAQLDAAMGPTLEPRQAVAFLERAR